MQLATNSTDRYRITFSDRRMVELLGDGLSSTEAAEIQGMIDAECAKWDMKTVHGTQRAMLALEEQIATPGLITFDFKVVGR